MATQVTMWEAKDGTFHRSLQDAEAHEFNLKLTRELSVWIDMTGFRHKTSMEIASLIVRDWIVSRRYVEEEKECDGSAT